MNRLFSLLLSLTLIGGTLPLTGLAQAEQPTSSSFIDVYTDHEFVDSIEYLKQNDIVQGYDIEGSEDRQFRADYQINRAELTKIMIEAQFTAEEIEACLEDKVLKDWKTVYFSDVDIDDWFAKYVCVAQEQGIVNGYPDGSFKPGQPVNFAEAAKVIANALDLDADEVTGEEWFKPFVRSLEERSGIPVSVRSFPKLITRGEMARMIHAGKEDLNVTTLPLDKLEDFDRREKELPQINSCDMLIDQLELDQDMPHTTGMMRRDMLEFAVDEEADASAGAPGESVAAPLAAQSEASRENKSSDDFSSTNTQVKGVDEADIIKNDGKYIYLIKGNTIRIVDAYPARGMQEVSQIEVDDEDFTPTEMYVDDDQMVIVGQIWRQRYYPEPMPFIEVDSREMIADIGIWPGFDNGRMKVYVYDISDRRKPVKQRSVEIEGNYSSSRKVGKNVYFVLNQWIPYYRIQDEQPADIILPRYSDSAENSVEKPLVRCTGIQYFPRFQDRNYLIVAGLDISDTSAQLNRRVLLGSSNTIYASRRSLYVATPHYAEYIDDDGEDLVYDSESTTLVYQFKLTRDEIEYQEQGQVPGSILNQFSMDENGDTFRIATTRDRYNRTTGTRTTNNLYILDRDSMNVIGQVEDIAPGERIKSMRFMGNRGYMVTFKNVDPLFVIDLKDPRNPTILGKLKIPGWSDYLHPYDENHLIGFGREVDPKAEEAERLTSEFLLGMKLSIFDVSDVTNPRETHKEVIGERGTTSELLYNHKALLFDKDKGLLAFPITITELKDPEGGREYGNIETVFSGGVVYDVDLTKGFTEKGKVTHYEDDELFRNSGEYFYGEFGRNIQRMLYIGEFLYSISPDYVRAYDLETVVPETFIKLAGAKSDDVHYLEGTTEF